VKGVKDLKDEQTLLRSFSKGDFTSVDMLISRYEDSLFNLCLKLAKNRPDAEELYQQTWLKAIQKSQSCTRSFKNWIYTVCLNTYRDSYRKDKRKEQLIDNHMDAQTREYMMNAATDNISAENEAMQNLTHKVLLSKVNQLPDKHRLPIILFYFEGMDYNESAKVLNLPVGTIKSRLNNAKEKLRREMESEVK
jgi:RNA polymerase sigma-70 factor (ECF subfamily)